MLNVEAGFTQKRLAKSHQGLFHKIAGFNFAVSHIRFSVYVRVRVQKVIYGIVVNKNEDSLISL